MNKAVIHKDNRGKYWFVGVYSNNYQDSQGDILSNKSHIEYKKWVDDNGIKSPITVLHQPRFDTLLHFAQLLALKSGMLTVEEYNENYKQLYKSVAIAESETVIPMDGFVLVVGKILPGKENVAESLYKADLTWGMSHGFISLEYDGIIENRIINKYRTFEFTILPQEFAANKITTFNVLEREMVDHFKSLSEEDRERLAGLLTTDPEDAEEAIKTAKSILDGLVASKSTEEVDEPEYETVRDKIFVDLNVEGLVETFKSFNTAVSAFSDRITKIEEQMVQINKSDDDKIAEQLTPPKFDWSQFGIEKQEGNEDLVEKLKENMQEKATDSPTENVLNLGVWSPLGFKEGK